MKKLPLLLQVIAIALVVSWTTRLPVVRAQGPSLTLEQVLARMEQKGAGLTTLTASISQKKWTDILEEFDTGEKGRLSFLKKGGKVFLRRDITQPQETNLVINDGKVTFYQPRIRQAQRYNLGQNKDKAEFLLLGFGSNRAAMKEAYNIRLTGQEKIGNRTTYLLELSPKSQKVSAFFSQIVLWVDSERWIPIRQKLVEPNRDYQLIDFDEVQINPPVKEATFELKLPKGVNVVG